MTTIYLANCHAVALSHYGRAVDGFVWSSDGFQNAWTTKCHSRRPVLQKLLFRGAHHPFLHYPGVSISEDKVGCILMTSLNTLWPLLRASMSTWQSLSHLIFTLPKWRGICGSERCWGTWQNVHSCSSIRAKLGPVSNARGVALSPASTLESPEELIKLVIPRLHPRTMKSESLGVLTSIFKKLFSDSNVQKRLGTKLQLLTLHHNVTMEGAEHSTPRSPGTDWLICFSLGPHTGYDHTPVILWFSMVPWTETSRETLSY